MKLPGPGPKQPNVYDFGTPYKTMYEDLMQKDPKLYKRNGLLQMLQRNMELKTAPEKWQEQRFVLCKCFSKHGCNQTSFYFNLDAQK